MSSVRHDNEETKRVVLAIDGDDDDFDGEESSDDDYDLDQDDGTDLTLDDFAAIAGGERRNNGGGGGRGGAVTTGLRGVEQKNPVVARKSLMTSGADEDDDEDEGGEEKLKCFLPIGESRGVYQHNKRTYFALSKDTSSSTVGIDGLLPSVSLSSNSSSKSAPLSSTSIPLPLSEDESMVSYCMNYSYDNNFIAAGCGDGSIRIFNKMGQLAYKLLPNLSFTSSTSVFTSSTTSQTSTSTSTSTSSSASALPSTCLRFRPSKSSSRVSNVLLSANADGSLTHWHIGTQTVIWHAVEQDNQISALDYSQEGDMFVTAGRDAAVRVYDENTKTLVSTMTSGRNRGHGHSNRVYATKFRPGDANTVVSGGWDNTLQIWDVRLGQSVRSIYGPHVCGDAIDMDATGNTILTGSWRPDEALQEWDFPSGKLQRTFKATHSPEIFGAPSVPVSSSLSSSAAAIGALRGDKENAVSGETNKKGSISSSSRSKEHTFPELLYCAAFSPNDKLIACGGSGHSSLRLFRRKDGLLIDEVTVSNRGVYSLCFSRNGRFLAAAGRSNKIVQVHDMNE